MRKILLIGAGRSSTILIQYLLDHASAETWTLKVGDVSKDLAEKKIAGHPAGTAIAFDVENKDERSTAIAEADLVISMLPAHMHLPVAMECLKQKKNLVTASYASTDMQAMHGDAAASGVLFLNECGLDPGLDHMSAMQIIDDIRSANGTISSFRSYTGGLVAPESNDNPWGYKFSWNPRNVILAGQGTAKFIENNRYKYIPYNRLFREIRTIQIEGLGNFDGYANRDSLSYRKLYRLDHIPTLLRGTLRQEGYCNAWNVFVKLGITDDTYAIEDSEKLSYADWIDSFLPTGSEGKTLQQRLANFAGVPEKSKIMEMVAWTGILEDKNIGISNATPAQILQQLLEEKWALKNSDRDMIVMQHQFEYTLDRKKIKHVSSLVVKGENSNQTAMAKTVGLPVAIAARLILNGKITMKGVHIPVHRAIYEPILGELKNYDIKFVEKQSASA